MLHYKIENVLFVELNLMETFVFIFNKGFDQANL